MAVKVRLKVLMFVLYFNGIFLAAKDLFTM